MRSVCLLVDAITLSPVQYTHKIEVHLDNDPSVISVHVHMQIVCTNRGKMEGYIALA